MGRDVNGQWLTRVAQPYPIRLCNSIAKNLYDGAGRKQSSQVPDVTGKSARGRVKNGRPIGSQGWEYLCGGFENARPSFWKLPLGQLTQAPSGLLRQAVHGSSLNVFGERVFQP